MVICIAEDRQSEEIAIKILILSLTNHCPEFPVELFFPPATDDFRSWIAKFSQVQLRTTPIAGTRGWNVKPYALLMLLEEGHDEVWWIDSDIILSCDFRHSIGKLSDSMLAITEEAKSGRYDDKSYRARAWGFEVGRILPFALNTAVIRATHLHIPLLKKWQELLESENYRNAQNLPLKQRPFHVFGDQDVLTALLASREFSEIPIKILRRGKNIIQYLGLGGFTLKERLATLIWGLPPFIHSQQAKPWHRGRIPSKWKSMEDFLRYLRLDISPYNYVASKYRYEVYGDLEWLKCHSMFGKLLSILGLGNPALTGLPIAIAYSLIHLCKQERKFNPKQAYLKVIEQPNLRLS